MNKGDLTEETVFMKIVNTFKEDFNFNPISVPAGYLLDADSTDITLVKTDTHTK